MKVPLLYQISEFDCGPISFYNALTYLFKREEIPGELIHCINLYTMDSPDASGGIGNAGTSKNAMIKLAKWINNYAIRKKFNLCCKLLTGDKVTLDIIRKFLNKNSVIIARIWLESEHYILITHIDKKYAYIFDSYYLMTSNDKEIRLIFNKPFNYNRKVSLKRIFSQDKQSFSLTKKREIIILTKF